MDRTAAVLLIVASVMQIPAGQTQKNSNWEIYSFHINATVTSRYAITVITSRVANRHDNSTEIDFHVKIPKTAFISKFRMLIAGKMYDGVVKAKEEAKQQYHQAVSRGQSAGLISAVGRTLEDFRTSVTVAAHQKVTFELTYEELLQRRLGKYELLINAQPGQSVKDFKIDVSVYEKPGINSLKVEGSLASEDLVSAITKTHVDKEAWVHFYPTQEQQMTCNGCQEKGLSGDLKIMYDVERPRSEGEILEYGGFFVHHFAPADLPRIPKNVVFIIDQSGSMHGNKIKQTRSALLRILEDLAEDDHFGLICFNDLISPWKQELLLATQQNLESAKAFVKTISDRGSTDINAAVLEGVKMIKRYNREGSTSILILLTDGDPTSGVTDLGNIQSNVRNAIGKKFPLYCLGFGFDVNFEFLQKMAQENSGVARRIYEDSDAALQLKGFYEEVAIPLLTTIEMNYTGAANLTQTTFSHYYNGSEIVVAGRILDNSIDDSDTEEIICEVIAISKYSKVKYSDIKATKDNKLPAVMSAYENFLQRLWACLTVKQLLEKELMLSGEQKDALKKEALDLSLKYSFVTPLTSMVVTKPEGEDSQVAHKPKEGEKPEIELQGESLQVEYEEFSPEYLLTDNLPSPAPEVPVRFLMAADGGSLPLCFDIPAGHSVRLLQDPGSGLAMNGELMSTVGMGFKKIVIHTKDNHYTEVDNNNIRLTDGQNTVSFPWTQTPTNHKTDSMSLTHRDNELEVSAQSIRVLILLHNTNRGRFLWPAVKQRPSNTALVGIMGRQFVRYEEDRSSSKLRIDDKEVHASEDSAQDCSDKNRPIVSCWLVELKFALQGELSNFTVSAL